MYTNLDQTAYIATAPTKHLWVVMGPCGTGKSTIGKHLSTMLGFAFVEGDDVSPSALSLFSILQLHLSPSYLFNFSIFMLMNI